MANKTEIDNKIEIDNKKIEIEENFVVSETSHLMRKIRSFVRREGRLTKGQQHALATLWPSMGVDYQSEPLDLAQLFGNHRPIVVEIGFGMGGSFVTMAQNNPQFNYLGIEVHRPGVGACLATAHELGVHNIKVICHDAVDVFEQMLPKQSIALVQLFFPDPWHKKRHNKRRIVQHQFVQMVRSRLISEGVFHLVTDWQPYAAHMLEVMQQSDGYQNLSETNDYIPRPESRPLTKFEKRGHELGHGVWDLQFRRTYSQSDSILSNDDNINEMQ